MNPKQLQEMMERAQQMQSKLAQTVVEASAGGGAVTVKMNGTKNVLSVKIASDAVQDVEMLQDLVMAAVNEAGRKVDEAAQGAIGGMLGGMGLPPGLF